MGKVFLSHSSKDKWYVGQIAEKFGKDHCVYDEYCFEVGMKNLDEIYDEMDKSSIFVFFISDNSLNSDWVKRELSIAEEKLCHDSFKLSQIFPIIIDDSITHEDCRIPNFIKSGFGSYNLRFIKNPLVAYRKIKTQQTKQQYEGTHQTDDCFYGRDFEISKFREAFDSGNPIKCAIASGLPGIGRSSYLVRCLKKTQIIENYYKPPTISMTSFDSIEDLIIKLSQVGFGEYALEDIAPITSMSSKISILSDLLSSIQSYKEVVLIYDDYCIIDRQGDIVYWFEKALKNIRPEVTVLIASRRTVGYSTAKRNNCIFPIDIPTLVKSEWLGLMRIYAKQRGCDLSREECLYFSDIITGYPPQVRYAVDLIKERGLEDVKNNSYRIVNYFSPKVTQMLESIIPAEIKNDAYGLLSFLSAYGVVPYDLFQLVINTKPQYEEAYRLLQSLTICKNIGSSGEYIEINALVSDHIQRSRIELPKDIESILESRLAKIGDVVNSEGSSITEDFEDLKFYLKSNIVHGSSIPQKFMYSTLYMTSIYELYNRQKYTQVISLVEKLKESGAFDRYDAPIRDRIQSYYCRALARETREEFYAEVEFFNPRTSKRKNEYNFLMGFMYRHESKFDKALSSYKAVLADQPGHRSAMREIVAVYRGLEDYENSYSFAKENYSAEPENPFQIQPFFEILVRKDPRQRSTEESGYIDEMLNTIYRLHQLKPTVTYFEMSAQYDVYINHNKKSAVAKLKEGIRHYPDSSFLFKILFDCYEYFRDIPNMESTLNELEPLTHTNKSAQVAYRIRQALLYAYQGKTIDYVESCINSINGLNDEAKSRLRKRATAIIKKDRTIIGRK